ncbi:MAG TPA: anhydro-N-acetylmuramic acid kinase [Xanthobacteraceae bacterium]|nr:anhydro-N-acetylmuramic acid kinase [Xanthobacteraceae bacterium]
MQGLRAIGLMSGTSLDGIDAAVLETDGTAVLRFGPTGYRPYGEAERACLRQALAEAVQLSDRTARPGVLGEAEQLVTRLHGDAVEALLAAHGIARSAIDVIGFHGQTLLHRPPQRLTVQIGDGAALAERLGVPVVFDFRAADVAAGGQGAPLVPVYHAALVRGLDLPRPVAVLNIGGVANVTWCDDDGDPMACDTGPGNALIDDFVRARTGQAFDRDGALAADGTADRAFVERALNDPFFAVPPPKSLDRNAFAPIAEQLADASVADGTATLAALTAAAVARVVRHLPRPPRAWIVAGGGARNGTLMRMLAQDLAPASVETADAAGWSADALEAQAFAYLAVRTLKGLPITFPTTTGVARPLAGGVVARPGVVPRTESRLS